MLWANSNIFQLIKKARSFTLVKDCIKFINTHLKVFITSSQKHKEWVEKVKPEIQFQALFWRLKYEKFGFIYPLDNVSIKVYHYWDTSEGRDLTNKLDTINDLLVSCGIVVDDNWKIINQIHSEGADYKGEINNIITTIDVTQRFF